MQYIYLVGKLHSKQFSAVVNWRMFWSRLFHIFWPTMYVLCSESRFLKKLYDNFFSWYWNISFSRVFLVEIIFMILLCMLFILQECDSSKQTNKRPLWGMYVKEFNLIFSSSSRIAIWKSFLELKREFTNGWPLITCWTDLKQKVRYIEMSKSSWNFVKLISWWKKNLFHEFSQYLRDRI